MNIILYIICTDRIWIGGDLISYVLWHYFFVTWLAFLILFLSPSHFYFFQVSYKIYPIDRLCEIPKFWNFFQIHRSSLISGWHFRLVTLLHFRFVASILLSIILILSHVMRVFITWSDAYYSKSSDRVCVRELKKDWQALWFQACGDFSSRIWFGFGTFGHEH